MEHIYHRGKYRSGEWAKHLRPFLKRTGNKRWRKDASQKILEELDQKDPGIPKKRMKKAKQIRVKFIIQSDKGFTRSYCRYYSSMRAAENAIKRNKVIRAIVLNKQEKAVKR